MKAVAWPVGKSRLEAEDLMPCSEKQLDKAAQSRISNIAIAFYQ